jgi:hypothetical protein
MQGAAAGSALGSDVVMAFPGGVLGFVSWFQNYWYKCRAQQWFHYLTTYLLKPQLAQWWGAHWGLNL